MSDAVDTRGIMSSQTQITPANSSLGEPSLNCTICHKRFKDPRLLPCLHSFCGPCLRTLDPYLVSSDDQASSTSSQSSVSSVSPGKQFITGISILCPICDVEVELPQRGVRELPIDFITRKLLLLDSLNPESCDVTCDLCTDNASAVSRCMECMANVCEFCAQAHKRQRKTAGHVVLDLQEAAQRGTTSLRCPVLCTKHPQEEIKMYCETCDCPVCRDCCLIQHREHLVEYAEDSADHHRRIISNLIARLEPHVQAINSGINSIVDVENAIGDHANKLNKEINYHFDNYIQTLQSHRDSLLKKVALVSDKRMKSLQVHKMQLRQILADMQHSCEFSAKVLSDGDHEELLSVKPALTRRLSHLSRVTYQCTPKNDLNNLQFKPGVVAGNIGGYKMHGILENKTVDPVRCYAEGQGISNAKATESASLLVITYDNEGHRHGQGGEHVTAGISPNNKPGRPLPCPVEDNNDGTYRVKYTAQQSGIHSLSICINGTHIKGSPFQVRVKPPTQKHSGKWQCCSFCSSEGNKNATCACRGSMPGGFKGCGHGHRGHPGNWHWSCCASPHKDSNHCVPVTTVSPMSTTSRTSIEPLSESSSTRSTATTRTNMSSLSRKPDSPRPPSGGDPSRPRQSSGSRHGDSVKSGGSNLRRAESLRSGESLRNGNSIRRVGSLSRGEAARYASKSITGIAAPRIMTNSGGGTMKGIDLTSIVNNNNGVVRNESRRTPSPEINANQVKTISI